MVRGASLLLGHLEARPSCTPHVHVGDRSCRVGACGRRRAWSEPHQQRQRGRYSPSSKGRQGTAPARFPLPDKRIPLLDHCWPRGRRICSQSWRFLLDWCAPNPCRGTDCGRPSLRPRYPCLDQSRPVRVRSHGSSLENTFFQKPRAGWRTGGNRLRSAVVSVPALLPQTGPGLLRLGRHSGYVSRATSGAQCPPLDPWRRESYRQWGRKVPVRCGTIPLAVVCARVAALTNACSPLPAYGPPSGLGWPMRLQAHALTATCRRHCQPIMPQTCFCANRAPYVQTMPRRSKARDSSAALTSVRDGGRHSALVWSLRAIRRSACDTG